MKKGETDGCIMLISEPKEPPKESAADEDSENPSNDQDSPATGNQSSGERSRKASYSSLPSTNLSRKTSSVTTPSFSTTLVEEDVTKLFSRRTDSKGRHKRSLMELDNGESESNGEMTFHISNIIPETPQETEHLRKVPIDNLDHAPHVLAQMASLGVRRKRDVKRKPVIADLLNK